MNQPPMDMDPGETGAESAEMSLAGRLLNVYAAPGEVFDEVKRAPFRASNWVVPAVLLILVSWVCSWLVFRQPAIEQQLREMTTQAVEKQMAKNKVPEAQAAEASAVAEKWSMIAAKISAAIAPVFVGFGMPFLWGVIVWLVGTKALKGDFGYMKAVEASGLASMISLLDTIVRTLLILVTSNLFASVSPTLLIKNYDPQVFWHGALALCNLLTLWTLAVRSIGLAKLSGATFARAATWVFGLWLAYNALALGAAFGVQALVAK